MNHVKKQRSMKKILLLLLLLISLTSSIIAQNPEWKLYTSGIRVQALAEEANTLWVGTTGGLVELDKNTGNGVFYDIMNSGLPKNDISVILVASNGTK